MGSATMHDTRVRERSKIRATKLEIALRLREYVSCTRISCTDSRGSISVHYPALHHRLHHVFPLPIGPSAHSSGWFGLLGLDLIIFGALSIARLDLVFEPFGIVRLDLIIFRYLSIAQFLVHSKLAVVLVKGALAFYCRLLESPVRPLAHVPVKFIIPGPRHIYFPSLSFLLVAGIRMVVIVG